MYKVLKVSANNLYSVWSLLKERKEPKERNFIFLPLKHMCINLRRIVLKYFRKKLLCQRYIKKIRMSMIFNTKNNGNIRNKCLIFK